MNLLYKACLQIQAVFLEQFLKVNFIQIDDNSIQFNAMPTLLPLVSYLVVVC